MQVPMSVIDAGRHRDTVGDQQRGVIVEQSGALGTTHPDLRVLAGRVARTMGTPLGAVTTVTADLHVLLASTVDIAVVSPRETSLCTHVVAARAPLVLCDTTRDPYFHGNPRLGIGPGLVRAYCGVPVTAPDGTVLAVLCAVDAAPRTFEAELVHGLRELARTALAMLTPITSDAPLAVPRALAPC